MPLPFVEHVDARIIECAEGRSLLTLRVQPMHFNSQGAVHGAALFTLADTGMGAALFSVLEPHERCSTIEVKINYFKPVLEGVESSAAARWCTGAGRWPISIRC